MKRKLIAAAWLLTFSLMYTGIMVTRLLLHNTDVRILGGVMTVVKYIVTMFTITMLLSPLIYIFTEMAAIKFPCIHSDLVVLVISIIVPYCVTIPLTEILITHSKKGK